MPAKKFYVVNSFAEKPFEGNPAAVFTEAEGLDETAMQLIAKQMNLVETVFACPSNENGAGYDFRYFTPAEELPIAGHPTIAAILALIEDDKIDPSHTDMVAIRTRAGKKEITIEKNRTKPVVMMEQQQPQFFPIMNDKKTVAAILGIDEDDIMPDLPIQPVDTGLGHLIVPVKSLEALMRVQRRIEPLKNLCQKIGIREAQVFTFETYDPDNILHTRNICPREGIEDPGCGVGNGALGAYLLTHFYKDRPKIDLRAEQGNIVNMPCLIEISAQKKDASINIWVGGNGKVMMKGVLYL